MGVSALIFFCTAAFLYTSLFSNAADTLTANQTISERETIVSAGENFELGFFSSGSSKRKYLGIWYKKIGPGTIVWVANRDIPGTTSLELKLTSIGRLQIENSDGRIIWSSHSTIAVQRPIAQLLDTGNLVVRDATAENKKDTFIWQSFDYPTDTFLPGMKLGMNLVNGLQWSLKAWKSNDDPSQENFTYRLDPRGYPQLILSSEKVELLRSGPWNGLRFSGYPGLMRNPVFTYGFVFNEEEIYYHYELVNNSVFSRVVLSHNGLAQRFTWVDRTHEWVLYSSGQMDNCDTYALCGGYGSCNINKTPQCGCLNGFEPKDPEDWDKADWSGGCVRKTSLALDCLGDGFVKYSGLKVPDTRNSWFDKNMNLGECQLMCSRNCSCTAYTNLDIRPPGSGCLLWFDELIDIRELNQNGQDLYVRLAASDSDINRGTHAKKRLGIIVAATISVGLLFLSLAVLLLVRKGKHREKNVREGKMECYTTLSNRWEIPELPFFDFAIVAKATKDFSDDNKLGEGGFGPVYKATFNNGQEVAVKRLSRSSRQGHEEFENEVKNVAKLQHRNLVKLIGYSIQLEEKLLIYEYMPNRSLDYFIFDQENSMLVDWPKRFSIINGIARGLLYLHQDSILRIIHRDLKAENILLDNEMNPKISDFGMARSFGGNETEANTMKVAGTLGYISPEYAFTGSYSTKSDVFSFGVLALEILSGKRNRRFQHINRHINLLGHAWNLHLEGRHLELIDTSIRNSFYSDPNVLRSIHMGLLCVQHFPEDRPNMANVIMMLSSQSSMPQPKQPAFYTENSLQEQGDLVLTNNIELPNMANVIMMLSSQSSMPQPKQPAFYTENSLQEQGDLVLTNNIEFSINEVTVTQLEGR